MLMEGICHGAIAEERAVVRRPNETSGRSMANAGREILMTGPGFAIWSWDLGQFYALEQGTCRTLKGAGLRIF